MSKVEIDGVEYECPPEVAGLLQAVSKDGRDGNDDCPYFTAQYAKCWREGHAQGKAEKGSGGTE